MVGSGMEGGGARVSPTSSGRRRHKALAPGRFQISPGVVFDGNRSGLETLQMSCDTAAGGGLSDSLSRGGSVDGEVESPAIDGDNEVSKGGGGGGGVGGDCCLESVDGDLVAKEGDSAVKEGGSLPKNCKIHEGLDNNVIIAEPHGANPGDLPGLNCNGTAEERDSVGEDCSLQFLMNGDSTIPGLRKGSKAVASWRFQTGYKPKWARDLLSGSRSGETEGPVSTVGDGSSKGAPVMAHNCPHLKGSATSGHRSEVQKGTGSAPKKRKVDKDDHRTSLVRENVLTKLREFRIIYKKLLEEEEVKWRGRGHGMRPDIAAFNIFREKFGADHDDMRYDGSIPGVRIGDVFNSTMELSIVGIHRAQSLPVDHIKKKDGTCLAVSVVSYAQPFASDSLDFLLHVGSVADTVRI